MTDMMEITETVPVDSDTDGGLVTHIIRKKDEMVGYFEGREVTALCGYRWVPTRDPKKFPICEACQIEAIRMKAGRGS